MTEGAKRGSLLKLLLSNSPHMIHGPLKAIHIDTQCDLIDFFVKQSSVFDVNDSIGYV